MEPHPATVSADRRSRWEPERSLYATVLLDAIECFQRYHGVGTPQGRRLFADAAEWIFGGDVGAPVSFADVCEALAFDEDALRDGLRHWVELHPAAMDAAPLALRVVA